jgi:hypothetical protein
MMEWFPRRAYTAERLAAHETDKGLIAQLVRAHA